MIVLVLTKYIGWKLLFKLYFPKLLVLVKILIQKPLKPPPPPTELPQVPQLRYNTITPNF